MVVGARLFLEKYVGPDGTLKRHGKLDDDYECFTAWPLVYAMGGDEELLDAGLACWNGITRQWTESGSVRDEMTRRYDMLHLSEGYVGLQNSALADPSIAENVERACRFADFYVDPRHGNYDPVLRLIRSPITGSDGPAFSAPCDYFLSYGHASLHPVVPDLEPGWDKDEARHAEIQRLYDEIVVRGDVPMNLAITGLVAHACILSGEARYRDWVLEYVDAWIERAATNGGIVPDNVGLSGRIGETRGGQWWGGFFGWSGRYGVWMIFHALATAIEAAWLLSRDPKYLDFYRSQIDYLLDRAVERDGDLLVPYKMGPDGWHDFRPLDPYVVGHLWHLSMDPGDWARVRRVLDGATHGPHAYHYAESPNPPAPGAEAWRPDGPADWHQVRDDLVGNKFVQNEAPHLCWLAGDFPEWPDAAVRATQRQVATASERLRSADYEHAWRSQTVLAQNPVHAGVLGQMAAGAPFQSYNGGLWIARLRYFDPVRRRPGLPHGVAALVEQLSADGTVVQLANAGSDNDREVIIQGGAYGEHGFTGVRVDGGATIPLTGNRFAVRLTAGSTTRLEIDTTPYSRAPSYELPW